MSTSRFRVAKRHRSVFGPLSSVFGPLSLSLSAACGRPEDDGAHAVENRWTIPVDSVGMQWGPDVHIGSHICGDSSSLWASVHSTPVVTQGPHTRDTSSDLQERWLVPDSHRHYYYYFPKFYLFS
jgi:hypothetical protein